MNPVINLGLARQRLSWVVAAAASACLPTAHLKAADPFAENVRTTPWLAPEDERRTFKLPPGFTANLFSSEPDIAKPMNMAFDAKGRMWVTVTLEYPYPVPLDKTGRDAIKILEDTDGDGKADKVTTFAEGLNIPIGIFPYRNGVIVWSIPNIWWLEDTDGDGKADKREPLYGPFGWQRDTHGMNSSFTRGLDGWIYATHGFNNDTQVEGKDQHQVHMNSGNTYRFRTDGSSIEQNSWGQVNPFGLCFDPLGNLFSADCHSEPVYQVLTGGYYPSFGKPHDGLGYAPSMIFHDHGSTAICGVHYYTDDLWPEEYQDNILTGNVMTCRVEWDRVEYTGSTPEAKHRGAFLSTDDPWFRPVNIQLGPDGSLYIADFYNRIIGHYEVPLDHPGRDRASGRIWRLSYTGTPEHPAKPNRPFKDNDLSAAPAVQLVAALASPNPTRRSVALDQLTDRVGTTAIEPLAGAVADTKAPAIQRATAMWGLFRLGRLSADPSPAISLLGESDRLLRVHALRALKQIANLPQPSIDKIHGKLRDPDALVRRCAAEALGTYPSAQHVQPLLQLVRTTDTNDTHLLYVARKALRDQFLDANVLSQFDPQKLDTRDSHDIAAVLPAVASEPAAGFLLGHLAQPTTKESSEFLETALKHAARYAPLAQLDRLAELARTRCAGDLDLQLALFESVKKGTEQRGATLSPSFIGWGAELASAILKSEDAPSGGWTARPVPGGDPAINPWMVQQRASADGGKNDWFFSTLPAGEQTTGILRSKTFSAPTRFSFYFAGHDGYPDKQLQNNNLVRLIDPVSGTVLRNASAPRNDLAQPVVWDLADLGGKQVCIEIVDADTAGAYAWVAVGRFDPPVVQVPKVSPQQAASRVRSAASLASSLGLRNLQDALARTLAAQAGAPDIRPAVAQALAALEPREARTALAQILAEPTLSLPLATEAAAAFGDTSNPAAEITALESLLKQIPKKVQSRVALALAGSAPGLDLLLKQVDNGRLPASVLIEQNVKAKWESVRSPGAAERIQALVKDLSEPDEARAKLIADRVAAFNPAAANAVKGREVFTKNCEVCHQIDAKGALVGPQLDGIGNRGLERVAEDVLDPNRNVDRAFRTTIVTLTDDDVATGLFRREEGETLVFAESTGKEFSLPKNKIKEKRESQLSLMPENFSEILAPADFQDLMAFLLSKRKSP